MSSDQYQDLGVVARLLRKQQALGRSPMQFTLGALLLGVGYLGCLIWIVRFIIQSEPLGIPFFLHLWFLVLWTNVVGGAFVSHDAWRYIVGGIIGVGLASPFLIDVFIHDFEAIPLVTGWSTSFVFAMFANLSGGISCFHNGRQRIAVLNVAAFVFSIVIIVICFST